MPDTSINAVDKSLVVLLQAEKDFPGYSLDFCSGYVSTDGVLLLKRMLIPIRILKGDLEMGKAG
jgi:hypothetical protein